MDQSLKLRKKELSAIEQLSILSCIVQEGQKTFKLSTIETWMYVPVENSEKDDGQGSKHDIVKLDVPFVKHCHCTEATEVCIVVVWESQCYILIKEVQDE